MKKPISNKQNLYSNGTNLDASDLTLDQNYNNLTQTGILSNHFGSGILADTLTQHVLFDTNSILGLLDGKALDCQSQPSDNNYGNQLELELRESLVAGKRTAKAFLIGLDFSGNLQYERFTFHKNEKQISAKHYSKILKVFLNDFVGDPNQSFNLGGRLTIKEAKSLFLSRNCIMLSQDVQPNIFLRDFFVAGAGSLFNLLSAALPSYNIDTLNINIGYANLRRIAQNDVSSQVGQKFQASTNNIQKITLLLSVANPIVPEDLIWTGNLIVNLYQLQSSVDCPLDIAPNLAIDFDPSNIPVAQLSFTYDDLLSQGIKLNETPQPVDFVFSNTPVGSGGLIKNGSYYAIAVKRGGAADKCEIQLASGIDQTPNSVATLFNGSIWVDVQEEDLWFQVWTDAAQVADGQAYDEGQGVFIPKTKINASTGATEDFVLNNIPFVRNEVYYGLLEAATEQSAQVQDQRTGESVYSQQQLVPSISLITANELVEREKAADPLLIGTIADKNSKSLVAGTTTLTAKFHSFGMIKNQCVIKLIDDPSDTARYDLDILNLVNEISGSGGISNINGLLNGKFTPDVANPQVFYRIASTEFISMVYGDLNGDGVVDDADLAALNTLLGLDSPSGNYYYPDLNTIPTQADYISLTTPFHADTGMSWQMLNQAQSATLATGTDGVFIVDPNDETKVNFSTASTLPNTPSAFIRINGNTNNPGNNGTFPIEAVINTHNFTLKKRYYTSDSILTLLRADINGDMRVDGTDVALMLNYVNKVAPFPNSSSPANKIGTIFNALRFTFEKYIDRADDYTASGSRATDIHTVSDILLDEATAGSSRFGLNLQTTPLSFNIAKQLNWYDYLVSSTSNPKLVSAVYSATENDAATPCSSDGILYTRYPLNPSFDPGKNDQFIPNNLIVNDGGQLVRPDGSYYAVDFETSSILLEIPAISFNSEKNINIFTDLVADYSGDGKTRLGYNSLRYADCSFVQLGDLASNKVRFAVSLNSFSPEINGTDVGNNTITGVIVDGGIGVFFNEGSGILTLNFNNLYEDQVLQTQKTRILITVFLKQAGFKNEGLIISSSKLKNLLGL